MRGDLALIDEVGHRQHRDQRGVLELDDRLIHQRRDHALDRLRQHDAPHGLSRRHAERGAGLRLAAIDRDDAAADDLRIERAAIKRQRQRRRRDRRHLDAGQDRQRVIEPNELHQDRRAAKRLDEGERNGAQPAKARQHAKRRDEAKKQPEQHNHDGEADGDAKPVQEEPAIAPENAEVPLIHACVTQTAESWEQSRGVLAAPLPLAGEVGAKRRVRALSTGGISAWRHPLPNPPPQAGEGAERRLQI